MLEIIDDCKVDSKKSVASKLSANFEHHSRVHTVGVFRALGICVLLLGFACCLMIPAIDNNSGILIGSQILVAVSAILMFSVFTYSAFVTCRCGRVSQFNYERQQRINSVAQPKRLRGLRWIVLSFATYISIFCFCCFPWSPGFSLSSVIFVVKATSFLGALFSFGSGLALIFGLNSKYGQKHLHIPRMLSDKHFGPALLIGKTDDELNAFISVAIEQGDFEQADMISRYLLHKAENITNSDSVCAPKIMKSEC